jgi:hypothetical protein
VRSLLAVLAALGWFPFLGAGAVQDADGGAGCKHRIVVWRVDRFAYDFSHRRLRRANADWASRSEFQWYSTSGPGARLDPEARRRNTLRAYFRQRMRKREQLRITRLHSFYEEKRNIRHFNGQLVRRARDLPASVFRFKGALSCRSRKLIVWSMASGGR